MKAKSIVTAALLALASLTITATPAATPPELVNYQGVLRDAADRPLDGEYGMVFRFFSAETAGDEILIDRHTAGDSAPVTVTGGLFNVALGSGQVDDGSGPGTYVSLSDMFRDYAEVFMQVEIAGELLEPRVRVLATAYSLNSHRLDGHEVSYFLDTSSAHQAKVGPVTFDASSIADYGVQAWGDLAGGYFERSSGESFARLASYGNGVHAEGATNGAYFGHLGGNTYAAIANNDYGIEARGVTAGGYFLASAGSGEGWVGKGNVGIQGQGNGAGGYFFDEDDSGIAYVASGDYGIEAQGTAAGGYFHDTNGSGEAWVGEGDWGIHAGGNEMGGLFWDKNQSGFAWVAYGDYGIEARGSAVGGYFSDHNHSGYAYVGYGDTGIRAYGDDQGLFGSDLTSGTYGRLGYGSSSTAGNGTKNFVQNHPEDPERVIVYSALEGDEAATYTRGSARLAGGQARVMLAETFRHVTHPEIGLTAHLTPRDQAVPLAVASLSTTELVVRGPEDVAFDYVVYGLRIGFEELPVVREKDDDAYLPDVSEELAVYERHPDLKAHSPLARFRRVARAAGLPAPDDTPEAHALVQAIGSYDRALHAPERPESDVRELATVPDEGAPQEGAIETGSSEETVSSEPQRILPHAGEIGAPGREAQIADDGSTTGRYPSVLMPVSTPVEVGDVLAIDPEHPGAFRIAETADAGAVLAVAVGPPLESESRAGGEMHLQVHVVLTGLASCKVDAGYGAIRPGDLLVASPTPGYAMRALEQHDGTVLGRAIEPLPIGAGKILVVVMPR